MSLTVDTGGYSCGPNATGKAVMGSTRFEIKGDFRCDINGL
jgi:hypothetical protein